LMVLSPFFASDLKEKNGSNFLTINRAIENKLMLSDKATVSDIVKAVILIASEGELYTSSGIVNISALTTIKKA
ncbi:hypothetical protein, partial [Yersinia enterocolitica]